jgi:hypothetical protein
MMDTAMKKLVLIGAMMCVALPAFAATQAEAEASLAAANAEEALARKAQSAWTPAEQALVDAKKALSAKDWNTAKATADEALALAKRSIEQSEEQKTLWRDAVIR